MLLQRMRCFSQSLCYSKSRSSQPTILQRRYYLLTTKPSFQWYFSWGFSLHALTCSMLRELAGTAWLWFERNRFLFKSKLTILYFPFQITCILNTSFYGQEHTREAGLLSVIYLKRFFWMVGCWVYQHRNNVGFKKFTEKESCWKECAGQDALVLPCQRFVAITLWIVFLISYLYRC